MALEMQRAFHALRGHADSAGSGLGLAIGIAYGIATIGAIGFEERIDYGAIGLVTNLAARMCDEARAGEILVDADTLARADAVFDEEPIGRLTIKGLPMPIAVVRVKGERPGAARPPSAAEKSRPDRG
jgi:class 3 adenylate cyclase